MGPAGAWLLEGIVVLVVVVVEVNEGIARFPPPDKSHHPPPSLEAGDCVKIGLFCKLIPGETALRLKEAGSKSSSRRRLPPIGRESSSGVGGSGVPARKAGQFGWHCGPTEADDDAGAPASSGDSGVVCSLIADVLPRAKNGGGGGVWVGSKASQKSLPPEWRFT